MSSGCFEGGHDAAAYVGGVLDTLETWCEALELRVPEIVAARAGCQNQRVKVDFTVSQQQAIILRVDGDGLVENDFRVPLPFQDRPQRHGHIGGRKPPP